MKLTQFFCLAIIAVLSTTRAQANNVDDKLISVIETPKPKIIALSPHIVEMLFDIGAGEQIIASTEYANYPLAAKKIPRIGSSMRIQLERVIELQPDLIIAWKSGNPSDDLARIKQLGFNVVYSQPDSFNDVAKELRLFGKLTGHSKQAEQVATKFLADLADIKKKYGNEKPLTGFYEVWSRPLTTIAKGSWPQQFLDICSINNPFETAETGYPQVNIEKVLQANIDVIIQPLSKKQAGVDGYNWQQWPILPAVKHQQIIILDADIAHRMTTRSLHALTDLCQQADKSRTYYQQNTDNKVSKN
tara:strand:+ start:308 stop:1216 length:909 start_codon:yes stop_codon:yes gene_type:complete